MARTTLAYSNFTGGEISPRLEGRTDLAVYSNSAKQLNNFLIHPHGGVSRRPGTEFISRVHDQSKYTRLIPFEFSTVQTYVLEFATGKIRFYKNQAPIYEATKTISAATRANPCVVTATSHGYSDGDFILIQAVVGMTELNGRRYKVANKTTNTFELQDEDGTNINSSAFTAYSSAGTASRVYTISNPYTETQLRDIKFTQSADVMYLVHPDVSIRKLTRSAHTTWTLTEADLIDGPYLDENTTATTMTPSHASGDDRTITASTSTFASTDVGRLITFDSGYAKIITYTSVTVVKADIKDDFAGTSATTAWSLGAFSDTTGHPGAATFFEQRLVFGSTATEPQSLFFSQSADYENYKAGTDASDAMIFAIASDHVNVIRWLAGTRSLLIGTMGGEFIAKGGGTDSALTPTNIEIRKQSNYGCASIHPLSISNVTVFTQRAKRKLREMVYDYDTDSFVAPDLTILAEHITESGVIEQAYQKEPDSVVWCVLTNGKMVGMTYQREQKVVGWHEHEIGGTFTGTHESYDSLTYSHGLVESVCTIPTDADEDELWVVVKRTIPDTQATCTITVSDAANIAVGSTITITDNAGTSTTMTATNDDPAGALEFSVGGSRTNDDVADNIAVGSGGVLGINALAGYSAPNPGSGTPVITVTRAVKGGDNLSVTTSDQTRLTVTNFSGTWTKRFIEKLKPIDWGSNNNNMFFLDSGLTFTASTKSFTNSSVNASNERITISSHAMSTEQAVQIEPLDTATMPGGINQHQTYFIKSIDSNTVELYLTAAGATAGTTAQKVGITSTGSGSFTMHLASITLTGLHHLEGQTITCLVNGATHPDATVSSGAITLDRYAVKAHIGLNYTSTLETLKLDTAVGTGQETVQGMPKRIHNIFVRLYKTIGLLVGSSTSNIDRVPFRSSADEMSSAVDLFNGDKEIEFRGGFSTNGNIVVQQNQPLPMTILSIYASANIFSK